MCFLVITYCPFAFIYEKPLYGRLHLPLSIAGLPVYNFKTEQGRCQQMVTTSINSKVLPWQKICDMTVDTFILSKTFSLVKTFSSWSAMFMRFTSKQYFTNWKTLIKIWHQLPNGSRIRSERHEVSFTRTFQCRENAFPICVFNVP